MKQSKKGFTLVEMMLVVAIIVILAGTAVVSIGDSLRKSQESQDKYQEHALLVDSARDNIHTMMHVNPPVYVPAPPTNNPGGNPGVGGGGVGGGGEDIPVGGGGDAPTFEEPDETEPEVNEPEITEPDASEPEVNEPEATEPETGSGSGSSTGGADKTEGPFTVKGGYVTEDGASGVRSVSPSNDGSYEIVIGSAYYNTDFKISVSGNTITFVTNKYLLDSYDFSFKGQLWKSDTFTLTDSDKAEFEKQFGLVF